MDRAQGLLHQRREPVDAFAKVHRLAMHVHLQLRIEPEHHRPESASIAAASSAASAHISSSFTPLGNWARSCGAGPPEGLLGAKSFTAENAGCGTTLFTARGAPGRRSTPGLP